MLASVTSLCFKMNTVTSTAAVKKMKILGLLRKNCNNPIFSAQSNYILHFQERIQQLENQLKEIESEKERELNDLRIEKRELIHTSQMVRADNYHCCVCLLWVLLW